MQVPVKKWKREIERIVLLANFGFCRNKKLQATKSEDNWNKGAFDLAKKLNKWKSRRMNKIQSSFGKLRNMRHPRHVNIKSIFGERLAEKDIPKVAPAAVARHCLLCFLCFDHPQNIQSGKEFSGAFHPILIRFECIFDLIKVAWT